MFVDFDIPVEGRAVIWCGTGCGIKDLEFHLGCVRVPAEVVYICAGDERRCVCVVEGEEAAVAAWRSC